MKNVILTELTIFVLMVSIQLKPIAVNRHTSIFFEVFS